MVMPQSMSSKKKCLERELPLSDCHSHHQNYFHPEEVKKINLPRHIRMVNETKIEGRERKCLFIILTIPSKPDLPWKLPHLKEIEIQ